MYGETFCAVLAMIWIQEIVPSSAAGKGVEEVG